MHSAVDASVVQSAVDDSPDPTPGVLRNWDEVPWEQPGREQSAGEQAEHATLTLLARAEAEAEAEAVQRELTRVSVQKSSASPVPAGLRLPARGTVLSGVGFAHKVRALHFPLSHSFYHTNMKSPCAEQAPEPAMTWTNCASAAMAVSIGAIFIAKSSRGSAL